VKKRTLMAVLFGLSFVVLSAMLYLLHHAIFEDWHHIFIYLLGDIAFLPIEVLLVTVIIHRLLTERERRARLVKLNMVIGAFFSEVGTEFIKKVSKADPQSGEISQKLLIKTDWSTKEFENASRNIRNMAGKLEYREGLLSELRTFLTERRDFLLRLLENPNLLEHESFTDTLWGIFHLTEELVRREDLGTLPETDRRHLVGDLERAYGRLVREWLGYMKHLKSDYPYLFSLAVRTNPFDEQANVVVG